MSNLFKQYNTIERQKDVRVIDCNARVEQRLMELARQQSGAEEPEEEGFRELGFTAVEVPKEDPEEVLQKAKDEAEEILRQAKEKSDSLLAQANAQAEEVLRIAKDDGHKEGYDEGFRQAKEELEQEYGRRKEELEQLRESLKEEHEKEMQELEPKLLDVILDVVEKVFHIQFNDKRDILLHLISGTIAEIEGCKNFRIRVGKEQRKFLENHRGEILDRIGSDSQIEVISDTSLEGNQCVIETETGVFDCSLGVQLENLIKDLRSLSATA